MFHRALFILAIAVFGVGCITNGPGPNDTKENARVAFENFEDDLVSTVLAQQEPAFSQIVNAIHLNYHNVDYQDLEAVKSLLKQVLSSPETLEAVATIVVEKYGFTRSYAKKMLLLVRNRYISSIDEMDYADALDWVNYIETAESVWQDLHLNDVVVAGED